MTDTPNAALEFMPGSTLKNSAVYNKNLIKIDSLLFGFALSRGTADPSSFSPAPSDGDTYIVPDGSPAPSGDWAGRENDIAIYFSGWKFVTPQEGAMLWLVDEGIRVLYTDAGGWGQISDTLLGELADVDFSASPALADGDVLVYDGSVSPGIWRNQKQENLTAGGGGGGGMNEMVIADKSTTQAISSATNTLITWDRDVHDPNGAHDPVTNNSRFTAWKAGTNWYRVKVVYMTTVNANEIRFQHWVALNHGGSTVFQNDFNRLQRERGRDPVSTGFDFNIEAIIQLDQNDYIEFFCWISVSGGITLEADTCFVEMEWLGEV